MNDLNELETLIVGWAKARGIVPNATPESQILKAVSEMGELADATLKGQDEEMQDAIGDVVVCLINLCALHEGLVFSQYFDLVHKLDFDWMGQLRKRTPAAQVMVAVSELGKLAEAKGNDSDMGMVDPIGNVTVCLNNLCIIKGWTLEECVWKAWEQIKDRRGTLLPNGCFVKEEAK